ncbi:hypothetical protein HZF05_18770 [Sphingomonas sp. CGMCC 1.13654]|uniref:Uncharacterized protein n=1 Tax=Sphingomonas chungangi TaxID=2683589 RepID=A0A838LA41_9SPHN|nr:hypothetical protein [Sphingomonas chungangi]MBA2936131.1 hypothetical protein [Sphingomonas chungangi]MVW55518.1 hypothetical protein [Sphingomonas chungangi]
MALPLLLIATAASASLAPPVSTWRIEGQPGAVTSVTGEIRTGGRLVGDQMVSDPDMITDERGIFGHAPVKPGGCGWASAVRPFTRLRRFAADGRLLWEWHVDREQQAIRLLGSQDGDCLSPDGGRLSVGIYRFAPGEPVSALGQGVVRVDHRPDFVEAVGLRSHKAFGGGPDTDLVGWKRGSPATLLFDIVDDEGKTVSHDQAVLGSPRKR